MGQDKKINNNNNNHYSFPGTDDKPLKKTLYPSIIHKHVGILSTQMLFTIVPK